jgi:hypothetical protein
MLYGCALRIFQLRDLSESSFWFSETDPNIAWVTVPAKVTKNQRFSEHKLVHPKFIPRIKEIIARRRAAGEPTTILFPDWVRAPSGCSDTTRTTWENLVKDLNQEAANIFKWPAVTSFHGTHNFRHGAAQDAFAEGNTQLVMLRTGHLAAGCANFYARADLERIKKSVFASLSTAGAEKEVQKYLSKIKAHIDDQRSKLQCNLLTGHDMPTNSFHPGQLSEAEYQRLLDHARSQQACITQRFSSKVDRRRQREQAPFGDEFALQKIDDCKVVIVIQNNLEWKYYVPKDLEVSDYQNYATVENLCRRYYERKLHAQSMDKVLTTLIDIRTYSKK